MKINDGDILVEINKKSLLYQSVIVPEPEDGFDEAWKHEFQGVVIGVDNLHDNGKYHWVAKVKDQEDNVFGVEVNRLTLVRE